jgi:hypothetical protein
VLAKRGMEAMTAHGILSSHLGVLVHDCFAPYWKLGDATPAFCNAHLLRELLYVKKLTGHEWTQGMRLSAQRQSALLLGHAALGKPLWRGRHAAFRTLYDAIVDAGKALHPEVELPSESAAATSSRSPATCSGASANMPPPCASSSPWQPRNIGAAKGNQIDRIQKLKKLFFYGSGID